METEFLLGVDNRLYVDLPTYESWLNLLDGLLEAKERDVQSWMRRADFVSGPRALRVSPLSKHRSRQRLHHPQSQPQLYQRARSSSPLASFRAAPSYAFTFAPPIPLPNPFTATTQSRPSTGNARPTQPLLRPPPLHPQYVQSQPPPQPPPAQSSGSKRTIRDAFSPQTIAQSIHLNPPKRPISLDMSSFHLSESSRSGFQQPSRAFATPPRQNSYAMDLLTPPDSVPQRTLAAPFIPDQTRAKSSFPQVCFSRCYCLFLTNDCFDLASSTLYTMRWHLRNKKEVPAKVYSGIITGHQWQQLHRSRNRNPKQSSFLACISYNKCKGGCTTRSRTQRTLAQWTCATCHRPFLRNRSSTNISNRPLHNTPSSSSSSSNNNKSSSSLEVELPNSHLLRMLGLPESNGRRPPTI
jgi:hypothetical protein